MFQKIVRVLTQTAAEQRQTTEDDACAYGTQLLREAREELNRADTKAQVLLGIVGIGLGAVTGGLLAGSWSPFALLNAVEWLWWVGAAAALASAVVLAGAVYPRLDRRKIHGAAMYYADILHLDSPATVAGALLRSSALDLERVADQLYRVSHIVGQKYRLIRWGFWLLLGGMAAMVSAALINGVLTGSSP